jgi:hypothetical protein
MVWGVSPRTAPGLDGRGEEWKTHAVVLVPGRSTQGGMQLARRTPRVAATMDEQPETAPSCTANTPATEPRQANEQAKSDRPERTQCKWNARHRGPYSTHPSWQAQSGAEGEQSLKPAAPSKPQCRFGPPEKAITLRPLQSLQTARAQWSPPLDPARPSRIGASTGQFLRHCSESVYFHITLRATLSASSAQSPGPLSHAAITPSPTGKFDRLRFASIHQALTCGFTTPRPVASQAFPASLVNSGQSRRNQAKH